MNNKGFTLVELLAIIAILALVSSIGTYAVITYVNTSREKSDELLIKNIKTASQEYIDECSSGVSSIATCSPSGGGTGTKTYTITTTLQELANYNFLAVTTNNVLNAKQEDIGECQIEITKTVDSNYQVNYIVKSKSNTTGSGIQCPKNSEEVY